MLPPSTAPADLVSSAEPLLRKHAGARGELLWEMITHGGSDRDFFRVRAPSGEGWVVMRYAPTREENLLYVGIAGFLQSIGVPVPKVLFHDSDRHLVGLEDLGDESLHSIAHRSPNRATLESLYVKTLEEARRLHRQISASVPTMHGFDAALYRWERNYFLDHLVGRWAGLHLSPLERAEIEAEGEKLSARLLNTPRCLIHRDFQSQNLIVRDNNVWMIDFQGMRLGHAAYDVASLLYDPYVDLESSLRASLLEVYAPKSESFERIFYQAAAQRLMQALGAYGFLGLARGKTAFLRHIPHGLRNLRDALEHLEGTDKLLHLTRRIQIEQSLRLHETARAP